MKAIRIVQIVLALLAIIYIWVFDGANVRTIILPLFVIPLPVRASYVVFGALALGLLVGYAPTRIRLFQARRSVRKLEEELTVMEQDLQNLKAIDAEAAKVFDHPEPKRFAMFRRHRAEDEA
jgi:uncharacterized integral membrane protein